MAQPTAEDILARAQALSARERLGLVSHLLDEIEGPDDAAWTEAWRAELLRRYQDPLERGGSCWEDVKARALRPERAR
ncbi:MAG: addiction module protein [Deltaproteobacteria bacterium]|nr:addiction module protein [Deltaproteobacteria bacterium]